VVVGQGETYEAAVADVISAIRFHVETFEAEVLESESPVPDAVVTDAIVAV
jgi:predicted RNase H-like HicB family nuclease